MNSPCSFSLLVLVFARSLEDRLADWLLLWSARHPEAMQGQMLLSAVDGLSAREPQSLLERVRGRHALLRLELVLQGEAVGALLQALSQAFAGADIEWRLSGLQQAGRLPVEALAPVIDSTHTEG
jgi:hypothetical protein